jgi:putative ABC transport system substrate-binding protein
MAILIRRREFIVTLGAAAAWQVAAHAQQPAMPVIGVLSSGPVDSPTNRLRAFHQGLQQAGFTEGENVIIEYRWAQGHLERLPCL